MATSERSVAEAARDQTTSTRVVSSVAPVSSQEEHVLELQGTVGNAALARDARPRSPISDANLAQMRADVEFIVARLKQQVLDAGEETELLNRVRAWAAWDQAYAATGLPGTPFLDRFLTLLKTRTFPRTTARMLFGLAGEEWINAYDGLFHELEGERGEQLREVVAKSRKQGTAGPETQQLQSVYGFVGRRVGMGAWGILKQMGLTVMSLTDAMLWATWRQQGLPGDPPQLSPAVSKQFDEAASVLADLAKQGATPEELAREHQELMEEYAFGDRWGKIVGILMSAGMGAGGKVVKAVSTAAQTMQGLQGVETAAKKIADRVTAMRKANPASTWEDFLADDQVRVEFGNGLAAVIGVIGGLAGEKGAVAELFKRIHLLVDAAVLTPLLKQAWMDYNDPVLALDPVKRRHKLEEHIATIVGTVAAMVGGKVDNQRAQQKAAAKAAAERQAAAGKPAPVAAEQAIAPEKTADAVEAPARAPAEEGKAPVPEEVAPGVTSPDSMPNVLLVDVPPAYLEAVLVELASSTPTGREVARRIRSGELQLTLASEGLTAAHAGAAMPNEIHVGRQATLQDTVAILIHEAVHQGDPGLSGGAPRSEVEATARVSEFEYRAERGVHTDDPVETIYREVLAQGKAAGAPLAEVQARARQAMIDMMGTDPARYGIESAEGPGKGPAAAPASRAPSEYPVTYATAGNYPDLLPGMIVEFPGGERVWRSPFENTIIIESTLGPGTGRQGLEQGLPSRGEYDVQKIQDHYMERAHAQGQGTGFESPYGIRLASELINQGYQNVGIEEFGRQLAGGAEPGVEFKLKTTTKTSERSLQLEWQDYKIEVIKDGKKRDLLSFKLIAEDRTGMPKVDDVTVTSDPDLVPLLAIPEMEGMQQRLEQLIDQHRQRLGLPPR